MQNEDNLRPIIGKKKKKKASGSAPTTNPYWSAMVKNNQNALGSNEPTLTAAPKPQNPPKAPLGGRRTLTTVPLDAPTIPKWEPKEQITLTPKGQNTQAPVIQTLSLTPSGMRPQVPIPSGLRPVAPVPFGIRPQVQVPSGIRPQGPILSAMRPQPIPLGIRPVVPVQSGVRPLLSFPVAKPQLHLVTNPQNTSPTDGIQNKVTAKQKMLHPGPAIRPQIPASNLMEIHPKDKSKQMGKLTQLLKKEIMINQRSKTVNQATETKAIAEQAKASPPVNPKPNPATPSTARNMKPGILGSPPKILHPSQAMEVVTKKIYPTAGQTVVPFMAGTSPYGAYYPKGVPRSFLITQPELYSPKNMPIWPTESLPKPLLPMPKQMFVETEEQKDTIQQQYSPSDVYDDISVGNTSQDGNEDSESPDKLQAGQKRLSAFHRLGPVSKPKKPKLTINLMFNKDQPIREVIDETEENPEKYTPVHIRQDILTSTDPIVLKYLMFWPWKKHMSSRKSVTARNSKTVMMLELEQMEDIYERDAAFIQVSVKGYPKSWEKEDVLDVILELLKGKSFIPCFIEFTEQECKFLVIRCRTALVTIHKSGFVVRKDDVELHITISTTDLSLNHLEFIPRLVLRKIIASRYDREKILDLSAFTLAPDLSHFIYFPLCRTTNQTDLAQMQSVVNWDFLTELDLSRNKLTSINNFDLQSNTPKLKRLNLSQNKIDKLTSLLTIRELPLCSIWLDGNPLCHDYIDCEHYIKVIRMIFPSVMEIDGEKVTLRGDLPPIRRNYSPPEAVTVVDKFLDVYFPLMDSNPEERSFVKNLYDEEATLTITYNNSLRHNPLYRSYRNVFLRSRDLTEGNMDFITSSMSIAKLINKYPNFEHDPFTFTTDVLFHSDDCTMFRVSGVVKLTAESLAEHEYVVSFVRTFVLRTNDGGAEYKIQNEMLYWDKVPESIAETAFRKTTVKSSPLSLKLEATPDEELKKGYVKIFMKLTTLDEKATEKCLEEKDWHLKNALEHFVKLLKLDDIGTLTGNLI